jgi:hypothetical protein
MWYFVMDNSGAGASFLRVLWFPLQIFIPKVLPHELKKIVVGFTPRRPGLKPGSSHVGFFDGQHSGAGASFLRVLWFPLPIFIPKVLPQELKKK